MVRCRFFTERFGSLSTTTNQRINNSELRDAAAHGFGSEFRRVSDGVQKDAAVAL